MCVRQDISRADRKEGGGAAEVEAVVQGMAQLEMADDAHSAMQNAAGKERWARLDGLEARRDLNGKAVQIGTWNAERERWEVCCQGQWLKVRLANLRVLDENESIIVSTIEAKRQAAAAHHAALLLAAAAAGWVRIDGTSSERHLNGATARMRAWDSTRERWKVRCRGVDVLLSASNLSILNDDDAAAAAAA